MALEGIQLAFDEENSSGGVLGRPLHLILRDTNSRPDEAARIVRDLIEKENAVAVIGEIASESSLQAAPVAAELGIPMISPGSTHADVTKAGPGVFRICYADPFQGRVMSKFASSIGVVRAATLHEADDHYSAALAASFEEDFRSRAGTISSNQTFAPGTTDFRPQLKAIKSSQPEVVFLPVYFAEAANIIGQARALGMDQPFIGTDGWESPDFLRIGGKSVDNCYFTSHFSADEPSPRTKEFVAAFREKFQHDPLALAALGYDSVKFLVNGIRRADSTSSTELITALAATQNFPGTTGDITLDADRNPAKPAIVLRVEDGKFTYLETVAP